MIHRRLLASLTAFILAATLGCMDVSPPVKVESSNESLLQGIHLPYSRAIYGVGNSDSIVVLGTLINGDTFAINTDELEWKIVPSTSALQIDSSGKLTAIGTTVSIANTGVKLIVSYKLGETTRADTATVFITNRNYNISTFRLISKDSARGGAMINSSIFVPGALDRLPKVDLEIKDENDSTPDQLSFINQFIRFVTSAETGKRFRVSLVLIQSRTVYPSGLYFQGSAPLGKYWVGVEAYMYGKHVKDSVLFTQMAAGEAYLAASISSSGLSVFNPTDVVQPCALGLFRNSTSDTLSIELAASQVSCNGEISPAERFVIAPGRVVPLRPLGVKNGSVVIWKIFRGSSSLDVVATGKFQGKAAE